VPHRFQNRLAPLLLAALVVAVVSGHQGAAIPPQSIELPALPSYRESIALDGVAPIDLTILSGGNREAVARLSDTAARTLRALVEWLGPLQSTDLTVVDLPWGAGTPGASYANVAETRMRLLAPARDLTAERSLVAALARQFWLTGLDGNSSFREALVLYVASRGIHAVFERRNIAAPRFLGGFVPAPIRALVLSPDLAGPRPLFAEFDEVLQPPDAPWRFAPAGEGTSARRAAAALRTLERIVGWPAMQQALAALRMRAATSSLSPETFAAVLAEQRGVSIDWFVRDLVRSSEPIDYAVGEFSSVESDATFRTAITIDRRGAGVFAATDRDRSAGPARSVQVLARFADLSESRAFVDGRDERSELVFVSHAPAVSAMIDPDEVVLIDAEPANNGRLLADPPADRTGLRLVMNWVIWLQHAMLTYTAIA
jgi:hypothetical protein